jgi:hypothetical protein
MMMSIQQNQHSAPQDEGTQEIDVLLLYGHANQNTTTPNNCIAHMVESGTAWVKQQSPKNMPVAQAIRRLSTHEHATLKSNMLAAAKNDLAQQSDLDQSIAYLQALGQLARAE